MHLLVNTHRMDAIEAAGRVAELLARTGDEVAAEQEVAHVLALPAVLPAEIPDADLVVSLGGDGTLIRAADLCSEKGTPILGVYYGRFGFVTQCHPTEMPAALRAFAAGEARIESRMMVQTCLVRHTKEVATLHSLNEASVQRAATTRMLDFEICVDGSFVTRYPADGVIVATPTGSTAYNLSIGGPVVDPKVEALLLGAIAPHTLSARPLVLGPESVIEVAIHTRGDAVLSCDGQSRLQMLSGDRVRITRSPRRTRLVVVDDRDFLTKLTDRLLWPRLGPDEERED